MKDGVSQELLDTSQYVSNEMQALEREQRQIDERAAQVEWELRRVMDKGTALLTTKHLTIRCLCVSILIKIPPPCLLQPSADRQHHIVCLLGYEFNVLYRKVRFNRLPSYFVEWPHFILTW